MKPKANQKQTHCMKAKKKNPCLFGLVLVSDIVVMKPTCCYVLSFAWNYSGK